jgi:hypothetical protein
MNNELGRKITSLTLMTIMVAGGLTFAVPGVMPEAMAANANLFVSAENSQFSNYFSGPSVVEVVIIDSDIDDTDQAKGEPDVTVNGKILRMVQAVDGNWYGYFADRNQAQIADSLVDVTAGNGTGIDFGDFCTAASAGTLILGTSTGFTDTVGVAVPADEIGATGSSTGGAITQACSIYDLAGMTNQTNNVVREYKRVNTNSNVAIGQIGFSATTLGSSTRSDVTDAELNGLWPFVQLYNFSTGGNVIVQYNKGGGAQSTTLTFDTVESFADLSLDRSVYPRSAQVHATITDVWMNIDPTDEDSWTFGGIPTNATTYYQLFDENGATDGDGLQSSNLTSLLGSLMCETNCIVKFTPDAQGTDVVTIQDNDDSAVLAASATDPDAARTKSIDDGDRPITFTETGPNTGVFGTYDESDNSALKVISTAARGKSATIEYNEVKHTILVGHSFASIELQATDDEWNSGEEIPVVLVDNDQNKNSRADEDLDNYSSDISLIPSLSTGDPFTLGEAGATSYTFFTSNDDLTVGTEVAAGTSVYALANELSGDTNQTNSLTVQSFSERATLASGTGDDDARTAIFFYGTNAKELKDSTGKTYNGATGKMYGFNLLNVDLRSFSTTGTFDVFLLNSSAASAGSVTDAAFVTTPQINDTALAVTMIPLGQDVKPLSLTLMNGTTAIESGTYDEVIKAIHDMDDTDRLALAIVASSAFNMGTDEVFTVDVISFGFTDDGYQSSERVANQIIRFELEETADNTNTFEGTLEYVMLNQVNILDSATYEGLSTIADDPTFVVIEDLTDEDAPRINYLDLGSDGVSTQIADQLAAPTHSGVVAFDSESYKVADTVTITLEDADLNVDSELIDIYTVVTDNGDPVEDAVGVSNTSAKSITFSNGDSLGRLLDVTFDDERWTDNTCGSNTSSDDQLGQTGFTLVETSKDSGIFVGDFQVPSTYCPASVGTGAAVSTTGTDIEVNYVDFRDASGEIIEVGDGAAIRANTGSISLDRTVYPVPFGVPGDFTTQSSTTTPNGRAIFPIHSSGIGGTGISSNTNALDAGEFIANGDLTIHIRVNDPDWDISAAGEDKINADTAALAVGPVKISVIRGSSTVILAYAGGPAAQQGTIDTDGATLTSVRELGPITEIAPDAGIFELDFTIRYTDGPASTQCPSTTSAWTNIADASGVLETDRFDIAASTGDYCILQGDILQVEYTDPQDASGDVNTVTDSATFDLRNGVLQSDKSVYIIGSDIILTLIEPDFDLDNDSAETYDLDLIEWDSDAATVSMGNADGVGSSFDPEPSDLRETGDSTGIFQVVVEMPATLSSDNLERGEQIDLEYTDWGPSGSDYVGQEDEDVNVTIYTSNFGATVELDQKVYTWTDKVYITIVAPDHNFDSNLIDEIGNTNADAIKIATRGYDIDRYKLVETGTDTGIFTGEVILTGFHHDADGNLSTGRSSDGSDLTPTTSNDDSGPTDGFIQADDDDGLTVSFEFSEDETVVGSALIRWNIGEIQWLEASYPATGTGVVRVIDPDMNLDPESVDNYDVDVWSDSDAGGIDLTVTETNEATGIFEGTVFFTVSDQSSGHRLRVAEGDTVTAEYEDNTLPSPYTTADELNITATTLIGTVVPPLERAPAANLRTVDAFGNSLDTVSVDQQVQITADLANGQDREQAFAYLVQIQDDNGVTVSLAWITGSLSAGQSFSPALSWIPSEAGAYTATAFVWESVDNPTALSPPVSTTVNVR